MPELSYEAFKDYVKDHIKEFLSAEYENHDMKFESISKVGIQYDALIIRDPSETMSVTPLLNLTEAYEQFQNGKDMDYILDSLADIRMNASEPHVMANKNDLLSWEFAKTRLTARLINSDINKDYLMNKPHENVADLSVVYQMIIHEDRDGVSSAVVTDDLMNTWGVDKKTLHDVAMQNISERPISFMNIQDAALAAIMNENSKTNLLEDVEPIVVSDYLSPLFVLSNERGNFGAALAANSSIMDKITDKLGPVYVLPSSVNEVLIVPKSECDVNFLAATVADVNKEVLDSKEFLSNSVYAYDKNSKTLAIAHEGIEHDKSQNKDRGLER